MASTRLKRKAKRNKAVAKKRTQDIKLLTSKPTIKKVDVEELKKEFLAKPKKAPAKKEEEAPKEVVEKVEAAEKKVEVKTEAKAKPKAKAETEAKKPAAKKPAAKKATPNKKEQDAE